MSVANMKIFKANQWPLLDAFLKNYVQAHPGRSIYGFSVDSDRPGYLKLCFLSKPTKDGGVIQTWVGYQYLTCWATG